MSESDRRRAPAQRSETGRNEPSAPARRRELFPLTIEPEDFDPRARRRPPAPLADLLGDIDSMLPTADDPLSTQSTPHPTSPAPASPKQANSPPPAGARPTTTSGSRPPTSQAGPPSSPTPFAVGPGALREAMERFEQSAGHLLRADQLSGLWPPLERLPRASSGLSFGRTIGIGLLALVSLLIISMLGGGPIETSRWMPSILGSSTENVRQPLFANTRPSAGDYNLRAAPSLSPEEIDRILSSYGSPATGTGTIWYNLGLQYGIDPAFALAFFIHESSAGTASAWAGLKPDGNTTHNVGNIICAGYPNCYGRFRDYPSWEAGIDDWYRLIDVEYLQGRGHRTVADIIPVYAPSFENDVNNYINVIQSLIDGWRGQGVP